MELREEHPRAAARNPHLFARAPAALLLGSADCSSMQSVELSAGDIKLAHDCWTGWGAAAVPHLIHVYTDGSYDAHSKPQPTSSWAVTVGDRWLDDNFAHLPTDERQLNAGHVGGATLLGASISATSGVYPAELQAIARALAAFPLSCSLHIHSDSQAAIAGIHAYTEEPNIRQRLRMAARPLLQLIHHLMQQRKAAGGTVQLEHIRAHSIAADIHSVGNRLADYKANTTRVRPQSASPSSVREFPLTECEHRLTLHTELGAGAQVIDDVRRSAIAHLRARQLAYWSTLPPCTVTDGSFASPALLDTSRVVLADGSPLQQAAFMQIATNSIQCCWQLTADNVTHKVLPLWCASCNTALTIAHLVGCTANGAFRLSQRADVLAVLSSEDCTHDWLNARSHLSLTDLLLQLFPPSPDTPLHLHITRVMCGVFCARQANAASKQLGCTRAKDAHRLMLELRLCCIDGIHSFFHALKIALP
jgi:ribonuclease HI